jgi:hypothetical protein
LWQVLLPRDPRRMHRETRGTSHTTQWRVVRRQTQDAKKEDSCSPQQESSGFRLPGQRIVFRRPETHSRILDIGPIPVGTLDH